jgi:hypothetical protein
LADPLFCRRPKKREKVGRKSDAIALYQKRKVDARVSIKLPDNLRQRAVSIGELGREAIQWYRDYSKRDLYTFSNRMELIIRELGSRTAESVKPKEIEDWLARHFEWSPATKNRYKTFLSKAYQLALKSDRVSRNPARLVEGIIDYFDRLLAEMRWRDKTESYSTPREWLQCPLRT